jgi:hypothetical protein
VEFDANFNTRCPDADIVPFAVYADFAISIGLVIVPTEPAEAYQLDDERRRAMGVDTRVVHLDPMLSGEGSALAAEAPANRIAQSFRFRRRFELLVRGSDVAVLTRCVFFTATHEEDQILKAQTLRDLDVAMPENAVTKDGIRLFGSSSVLEIPAGRTSEVQSFQIDLRNS